MAMDSAALAPGEEVVRRYFCTTADSVLELAGTVLPLRRRHEGDGVLTLTNRRLMFDMEPGSRRDGSSKGSFHQETLLSDVSSVSASISRVRRGLALPLVLVILGLALMLVPYAVASEDGSFVSHHDYNVGRADGAESGYYEGYLFMVLNPDALIDVEIPEGYHCEGREANASAEYNRGFDEVYGSYYTIGVSEALLGKEFSAPSIVVEEEDDPWVPIMSTAAIGLVLVIAGALIYSASGLTSEWASIRLGASGRGAYITSASNGFSMASGRGMRPSSGYEEMIRDLGAAMIETRLRAERSVALRVVEEPDDYEIIPPQQGLVDRGEEGGIDEERPDLYGEAPSDDGIVYGGGTDE